MATFKVTLKLLIDKKRQKVLFAEAGKDFVDFLFALLALSLGTVTSLLETNLHSMVGCLGDLYESVKNLQSTYIRQGADKNSVLKPAFSTSGTPLLLPNTESLAPKIYVCPEFYGHHHYAADNPNVPCPSCNSLMSVDMKSVSVGV